MRNQMYSKTLSLLSVFLMLGLLGTGCGGGDTPNNCDGVANSCVTADASKCNTANTGIQTCQANVDGCLVWTDSMTCGDRQTCDTSGADVACRCNIECTTSGETQCSTTNTTLIQTCTADAHGCLYWADGTDCADTSQYCDDTNEPAVCSTTCTNQCTLGETQCNGTIIQGCAMVGTCTDWVNGTDCDDNSLLCNDLNEPATCVAACTHECNTIDATQCNGEVIETCTLNNVTGCNEWDAGTDCSTNSEFCVVTAGVAACSATCEHHCDTVDATQCDDQTVQTCTMVGDCRDWVDGETCVTPRFESTAGACVEQCSDNCDTVDAKQCVDTVIQTCSLVAATGCNDWVDTTDCATTSQFCDSATTTCVDDCTDDCDLADPDECNAAGTDIMTCEEQTNGDGCNDWVVLTDCTTNSRVCYDYTGTARCENPCTDDCDLADLNQCNGTVIETCEAQTDTDGCNDWVTVSDCAGTALPECDDQSGTVAAACVCADECEAGTDLDYCTGNVITTCGEANDGDTCTEWVPGQDCADLAATPLCDDGDGSTAAACVCADECSLSDPNYCDANVIMTCEQQADTCNDWVVDTDCEANDPPQFCDSQADPVVCSNTCTDECELIEVDYCDGTIIMTCELQADNCNDWVVSEDCADTTATPVCNDHGASENATCWCVDECAAGTQQCAGNVIEDCGEAGDGDTCVEWVTGTDCAANEPPEFCNEDQGTASCVTGCTEILADGGFEGGTHSAVWAETGTHSDTPLCDGGASCGNNDLALSGSWYAWIGGWTTFEEATLAQDITIPAGMPTTLYFFLWTPAGTGLAEDYFHIEIDGDLVFAVTAEDQASQDDYSLFTVDLSAYADGGTHTMLISGYCTTGSTNFIIDDLSVGSGPACCVDQCIEGETFCDGTVPTSCVVGSNSCTDWEAGADCLTNDEECQMVGDPAVATCVACTNECDTLNDEQCNGSAHVICEVGPDNCNDWVVVVDCADNDPAQYCDDSGADPVCADFGSFESGDTCAATPLSIPANLPTSNPDDTTCGATDDYSGTCVDPFDDGPDVIYNMTVTEETVVAVFMATDTTGTSISLSPSCPPGTDDCVIASALNAGNWILGCYRLAAGDYTWMFDTGSDYAACSNVFTLGLDTFCECATDETMCVDANTLATCDEWGTWDDTTVCPAGCGDIGGGVMGCLPECTPGETQCADANTLETCDSSGFWVQTVCSDGCGDVGGGVMGCLLVLNCTDLGTTVGTPAVVGDNTGATDDTRGTCGYQDGGVDVCYTWEAPTTGTYIMDTEGSTVLDDTVLYVYQGATELACNEDIGGGNYLSLLMVDVVAGQVYTIVVDGYTAGYEGSFNLNINEATAFVCNGTDLGTATGLVVDEGDTTGATDDAQGDCTGGSGGLDVCYLWEAPTTGSYTFDTDGSTSIGDSVLYMYEGAVQIACDDDIGGGNYLSEFTVDVVAGQQYVIVVDGYSATYFGLFDLNITAN